MSEYLFENLSMLNERISKHKRIALFLDYDGTLTKFTGHPMDAVASSKVQDLLKDLIDSQNIDVCVVTGRTKEDIEKLLPLEDLKMIWMHGFGSNFADIHANIPKTYFNGLDTLYSDLAKEYGNSDSLDLHMKGRIGLGLNYRRYAGDEKKLIEDITGIIKRNDKDNLFRIMYLSKNINIMPRSWDKGSAIEFVLNNKNVLPVYIGDDVTDEDAFSAINKNGITIYVKNGDTRDTVAEFFVDNPHEVIKAIEMLFIGKKQ